jgi:hypothetical protein
LEDVQMTQEEVKQRFVGMQPDQQQRVLALLALNVTVAARTTYPGQVEERLVGGKLRAFNEVLHTIAGQLLHLIDEDSNRYPDDALIDTLFETAQQGDCARDLADAFAWSFLAPSSGA